MNKARMTLDWLVVGGGPHGVHVALRLIAEAGVKPDAVRILDDEPNLLARWRRSTRNTGMRYLRSPGVHHIDLSWDALQRFAADHNGTGHPPFTRPYSRPALDLFDLHCDSIIDQHRIRGLHVPGRATHLRLGEETAQIRFEDHSGGGDGEIEARNVVLAIGAPRDPEWPDWARRALPRANNEESEASREQIRHLFEPGYVLERENAETRVAVIGAGISGAQVALRLADEGCRVTLFSRGKLKTRQFDSDPGWQGPKNMDGFSRVRDPNERRRRIRAARYPGSMPPDVHKALRRACADGRIEVLEETDIQSARLSDRNVTLEFAGGRAHAERVLLATGFPAHRPGGPWLDDAVDAFELPLASCGYPIVDRALRWHPRLYVTGALAELELGPVSRNLSGARRAGDRIVAAARATRAAAR